MRHSNSNKKFGRETGQRTALMRSLVRSLVLRESITTTEARAKTIRSIVEKLVTRGKNPTLANQRLITARFGGDERAARKVLKLGERLKERAGGYVRVVKMPPRKSDGSPMAVIQFVDIVR